MNTLSNPNPLEENHKNTLKSHEIKIGNSFHLGEENASHSQKIDVTDDAFLDKLTPELSNKIKETLAIAKQQAQNVIQDAQQAAEGIKQDAHSQGFQEGQNEGRQQGYQDGFNQATNDFIEKAISLDRLVNSILNAKYSIYHSSESELVDFIILIAKKLAHTQITMDKEAIKNIIIDASTEIKEKESLKVLIHPNLAQKIYSVSDEIKAAIYGLKNLRIIEDRTISPDGVVLESPDSRVDARLATQVDVLLEKLMKEKEETPILEEKYLDDQLE
jgi:flagellar assembly protein FliH